MSTPASPIIDKIRKLQALAERAGTEAEAAVAAARVRELLAKHNLDIGVVKLEAEPGVERQSATFGVRGAHLNVLARTCCELFDVECFWIGRGQRWRVAFVGLEANVETAVLTFHWLVDSVESLLDGWKREKPLLEGFLFAAKPVKRSDYTAFRSGCAIRISELAEQQKQQAQTSMELVHVGNAVAKRMVDGLTFRSTHDPDITPKPGSGPAFRDGYLQGERVDIHGARKGRMVNE